MRPQKTDDRGMTLMELTVVMAVFALVAILGLQALTGTLRTRDKLVQIDTKTANITLVLSLLRADLNAAVPLLFHPPAGGIQSALDINAGQNRLALSVSGKLDLPGELGAGLGRVIWRYDADQRQLIRQSWPILIPADTASLSPEVIIADGITDMAIRTMTPRLVWVSGLDPANIDSISSALPPAIEVTLQTADFGQVSIVASYP